MDFSSNNSNSFGFGLFAERFQAGVAFRRVGLTLPNAVNFGICCKIVRPECGCAFFPESSGAEIESPESVVLGVSA